MADRKPFLLTKIIATLGPASDSPEMIAKLITEGARVFRINFSHGSFEGFAKLLAAVRGAAKLTGIEAGVLGDLCGPKIRIGDVVEGGLTVKSGDTLIIQKQPLTAQRPFPDTSPFVFSITAPQVIPDIQPGERLLINDGEIRTLVTEKPGDGDRQRLVCQVTTGGKISRAKGVNLPDSNLSMPSLTEYDLECVKWAVDHDIEYLALSFVRHVEDVMQLKMRLKQLTPDGEVPIPVIAKIEKPQALDELEQIVIAADSVMVARGDLGVEMDLTQVPIIQKRIINLAHEVGRPVIVATQMLQSMIESASPTRAEVSDVANAIFDGAGKVMLSGETAVGQYPVQAVNMMARIAATAERERLDNPRAMTFGKPDRWHTGGKRSAALAYGVKQIAADFGAKLVIVWSQRGGAARYLSLCHMGVPVIAASSDERAVRRMSILYGIHALLMDRPASVDDFIATIDRLIRERGWAGPGDPYVLVAGEPIGLQGATNSVSLRYLSTPESTLAV